MNVPSIPRDRLDDAVAVVAIGIDEHDVTRAVAAWWYHRGPRALWVVVVGTLMMPFGALHPAAVLVLAVAVLVAFVGSRTADWAHEVRRYDDANPCPHCPAVETDDEDGAGGVWMSLDDSIPPAPAPMPELDDDRIRDWAGDADQWLIELAADARLAEGGELK